jgi:uncharacterized glyoxalase superfamily protein PhnB
MPKRTKSAKTGKRKSPKAKSSKKSPTTMKVRKKPAVRKTPASKAARRANVMPCLTYRDAPAAIEFLCGAFGFAKKMVVKGDGDAIAHAELTLGNAMVMLGSHKETEYGKLVKTPAEAGICTQTIYLIVPNPDAHHAKAKAAGAEIVIPLTTQDYGGRDYTCRDLEGHIWTFGTYDPWA